jgi:hypothetical protein
VTGLFTVKKGCLIALGIPLVLVAGIVVLLWFNFYTVHVRYRLTVEVQDGDQIKTGSSVVDVSYNIEPAKTISHWNAFPTPVGYAPTVDLGDKGLLFLTFANAGRTPAQRVERNNAAFCLYDDIGCLPFAAYHKTGGSDYGNKKAALDELLHQTGPRDVPFEVLPELIRFRDINDPRTLERLAPNSLAASFGAGVVLKRVVLQLTADPVTPPPKIWPQWMTVKGQDATSDLRGYENFGYHTTYIRYRLTVEVRDGDQIKTGSSVIGVSYMHPWSVGSPVVVPIGHAPTVDLGAKGMLFLTFKSALRTEEQSIERDRLLKCPFDDLGCLPFAAYSKPGTTIGPSSTQWGRALDDLPRGNGPGEIHFALLPALVRFQNINDEGTRRVVSPSDLTESFGPGVELKRVTLELTNDNPDMSPPEMWPQWMKTARNNSEFYTYQKE